MSEQETTTWQFVVTLDPRAQTNAAGEVALKYYQPGQVLLQSNPSGREYVAATRANVCMVWVDGADVDHILSKKGGCCNKKRQLFDYANEDDVRRWTNGGGR